MFFRDRKCRGACRKCTGSTRNCQNSVTHLPDSIDQEGLKLLVEHRYPLPHACPIQKINWVGSYSRTLRIHTARAQDRLVMLAIDESKAVSRKE
jgi:hypothetical protein